MLDRRGNVGWAVVSCVLAIAGCDAFSDPIAEGDVRVIPTDTRPVQQALMPLPPISGGTLTVNARGTRAVIADPDRNVVTIVDLIRLEVAGRIALEAGDEPGRVAINPDGVAYVALRRGGALLAIDTETASIVRRTAVCGAPRGVAYDAETDRVHVACAGGELVALNGSTGDEAWRSKIDVDLRDVVVHGDELVVSRFKSAQRLHVDKEGKMLLRTLAGGVEQTSDSGKTHLFDPTTAWRTVVDPTNGEVVTLHQRAQRDEVVVDAQPESPSGGGSSYGGGGGGDFSFGPRCDSIVHSAITIENANGQRTSAPIPDVVLAVDMAVSESWIAVAIAGPADPNAPRAFTAFDGSDGERAFVGPLEQAGGGVALISKSSVSTPWKGDTTNLSGCANTRRVGTNLSADPTIEPEQVTSVAFTPSGDLLYLTRNPSSLNLVTRSSLDNGGSVSATIELGGESIADTGHDIFHRDSGGGIACASCHAEGGDDGHVWTFNTIGDRRTQAVNIGLEGTAPFHWDGDMSGIHQIMDDVFVGRMGGVRQSDDRLTALSGWVFEQSPPAPIRSASDRAAIRGHELFMAPEVGCASCHSGTKLTDNRTVAVGTGDPGQRFQVPSLVGIGYRAPFLHTGCAPTLRDRFTSTACSGGDQHGSTSELNDDQIDDLVAYLETL